VHESQQVQQQRRTHRAAIQDAGEEANDSEPNSDSGSDGEDS
jgi:hypothetical protein